MKTIVAMWKYQHWKLKVAKRPCQNPDATDQCKNQRSSSNQLQKSTPKIDFKLFFIQNSQNGKSSMGFLRSTCG